MCVLHMYLVMNDHLCFRDVPRAVAYSFLIVILMFVSTSFSYYIVLSPAEVMHSDAVAMVSIANCLPLFSQGLEGFLREFSFLALLAFMLFHIFRFSFY